MALLLERGRPAGRDEHAKVHAKGSDPYALYALVCAGLGKAYTIYARPEDPLCLPLLDDPHGLS